VKPTHLILATLLPLLLHCAEKPAVEQLFNVQTVKVEKTTAARTQTNYGYVRAEASRTYDVSPRFGGYVQTLYADTRYLRVTKGEALARVYSPEVLQAKEDYLTALRFNARTPSPGMVRSVREKLSLLGVSAAEIAAVRKTMKADPLTTILAPESGWIFVKNVRRGSAFKKGTTLFTIVDLSRIWVEVQLYQTQLPLLPSLETFTVRATGVDRDFSATKKLLYPDIDPKAATATLRLEVANPDGLLLPGMYATITSSAAAEPVLTLPRTAVIRKNGAWYVFRAGDFKGVYDPVKVDVVPLDEKHYRIRSGLHAGDVVADNALFMMDADAQINGLY
jgi:membrane fusion protein, copper/silver efflux system